MGNPVTEIRSFYSLKELDESIEEEINSYKAVVDEYSQRLGSILRRLETTHGDQEWIKKMSALQKSFTKGGSKGKGKGKKSGLSPNWVTFKEILLCTDERGEAEILFEAMEEMNKKITRLTKIRNTIDDLQRAGLGNDVLYIAYVRDEVPEKIVLRKKGEGAAAEKFEFIAQFFASKNL